MFSLLKSFIVLVILGMSSLAPSAALHVGMCKQREESSTANNVQPGTAMLLTAPTRITTSLAEADEKPTSLVQPLNGVDTDNSTSESHPVSVNNDATSVAPNPRGKAATTQRTAQSNTNVASPPSAAAAEGGSGILTLNIPHQGHATNYLTSDGSGGELLRATCWGFCCMYSNITRRPLRSLSLQLQGNEDQQQHAAVGHRWK